MSFETLRAGVDLLVRRMAEHPEDAHKYVDQLRDKLAEMRDLGLPMPASLCRIEECLAREEDETGFENMPV